jgi:hypothetical protein
MDPKKCLENVTENLILANLPLNEQKKLRTHLELVSVKTRQELDSVGGGLPYICFLSTVRSALWNISGVDRGWR